MSKLLRRARNVTVISLLTFWLILICSTTTIGQTSSTAPPQIQGVTQVIEGRILTIPKFSNSFLNSLMKSRKIIESQLRQAPELKKAQFLSLDSNKFLQLKLPSLLAVADNYWSKAEYTDVNVPASQYASGTVTCSGQNQPVAPPAGLSASYLELSDYAGKNGNNYGKRWLSSDQLVEGGCGVLKAINNGKEPTGRLVWGSDVFKIVLDSANERIQRAEFSAYMRVCANLPTGRTCTPYFIRLPWFPVQGNNWVAIGTGLP